MTGSLRITGSFQVDNGTSTVNALTAESVTISGDISGSSTSTGSFGIVQSTGLTANESVIVASDGKSLTSSDLISYDTVNSRVGIGTTSPSVKLDIVGESSGETQVRMGQHSDDSDAPDVRLFKSRGSVSSPTAVNDNDNLAFFNSFAYNGSSYVQAGAFGWQADGTDGDSQFIINTRIGNTVATRLLINPVGDVVLTHDISGSSASTGSFGKLIGDGSDITNLPSAAITSYSSTGDNRIVTSVNATDVQGEANLTFDGTSLTLTGNMTASGDISGSSTSTGSFGVIEVGGGTFTSASLASGGSGGDSSFTATSISGSWRGALSGSLNLISGSSLSTGSFGVIEVGGGHFTSASLASGGGTGTGFPFSGSAVITGSMFISGSTTSIETLGHVSGSSTSTASFGRFEGDGSGLSNIAAAIEVSDEGSSLTSTVSSINFVGDNVTATNSGNDVTVTLNNTNSTGDAKVVQISSASTTWAVTHSLATKYPVVTIWDDNDQVIIPASITADTTNTATITFEQAMTGRASFTLGVPSSSYFVSESNQILTTVADSTIDGDLTVTGILTAQEFHSEFTSASIVYTSGSHKFGDTMDDTHEFTGSVTVTGSVTADTFSGTFSGALSSSAQIADDISGSFTVVSSSFSTRITTAETELSNTLISSSAQIADDISGSFTTASSSLASRITTAETELNNTLVSSSAQIASDISGSWRGELSSSVYLEQVRTTISGSFNAVSASISSRLDTLSNDIIALSIALG